MLLNAERNLTKSLTAPFIGVLKIGQHEGKKDIVDKYLHEITSENVSFFSNANTSETFQKPFNFFFFFFFDQEMTKWKFA